MSGKFATRPHNIICGTITTQVDNNNDWRNSLLEYLTHGYSNGSHIIYKKMAWHSKEIFIEEGSLERILSNEVIKICLVMHEVNEYLQKLLVTKLG